MGLYGELESMKFWCGRWRSEFLGLEKGKKCKKRLSRRNFYSPCVCMCVCVWIVTMYTHVIEPRNITQLFIPPTLFPNWNSGSPGALLFFSLFFSHRFLFPDVPGQSLLGNRDWEIIKSLPTHIIYMQIKVTAEKGNKLRKMLLFPRSYMENRNLEGWQNVHVYL